MQFYFTLNLNCSSQNTVSQQEGPCRDYSLTLGDSLLFLTSYSHLWFLRGYKSMTVGFLDCIFCLYPLYESFLFVLFVFLSLRFVHLSMFLLTLLVGEKNFLEIHYYHLFLLHLPYLIAKSISMFPSAKNC